MTEEVNCRFKTARRSYGTPTWKIAKAIGCHENTLYRRLREQLPPEEEDRLIQIIKRIAEEGS